MQWHSLQPKNNSPPLFAQSSKAKELTTEVCFNVFPQLAERECWRVKGEKRKWVFQILRVYLTLHCYEDVIFNSTSSTTPRGMDLIVWSTREILLWRPSLVNKPKQLFKSDCMFFRVYCFFVCTGRSTSSRKTFESYIFSPGIMYQFPEGFATIQRN